MSDILKLNCHILGQHYTRGLRIEINHAAPITKLKEIIKEKGRNTFQRMNADDISLWKVSISRDSLANLPTDLSDIPDKTELNNSDRLSHHFLEELVDEFFHILVEPLVRRVGSLLSLGDTTIHQSAHSLPAAPAQIHKLKRANPSGGDEAPYHAPKRPRLELLDGSKTVYKTNPEGNDNISIIALPNNSDFKDLISTPNLVMMDKTRYIEMLDKNPRYQYIFLRPRRWGKSTFLQTLANYYDKNNASSFNEQFGELYIGKHPTRFRNSYLVLLFDFSTIPTVDKEMMVKQFHSVINTALRRFLKRNANFLKKADEKELIKENASESLTLVLDFVKENGEYLFVGVDEYDAPANSCLFSEDAAQFKAVTDLFNTMFYAVMKQAMGAVIHKYWLTGVLPAFRDGITTTSPLSTTTLISMWPEYHGLCGLTEDEVRTMAQAYLVGSKQLDVDAEMREIKRWYGGYKFHSHDMDLPSLYNPQQVYTHLERLRSPDKSVYLSEEAYATHSISVLDAIGSSSNAKTMSFQDLFLSVLSGQFQVQVIVTTGFGSVEVKHLGRDLNIAGSLLYYFGVVTFTQKSRMLGIPNATMRYLVTQRFQNFLKHEAGIIEDSMNHAQDAFSSGDLQPLVNFFESFLQARPVRSVKSLSEETFQAVVETIFVGTCEQCQSELCLIVDPDVGPYGSTSGGRFGFVDLLFTPALSISSSSSSLVLVIEFKSISLLDLWMATGGGPSSKRTNNPTESDLLKLRETLKAESSEELLHRQFSYYDENLHCRRERSVADVRQAAVDRVGGYLEVISRGNATSGGSSGLCDRRVHCDEGDDRLIGHVVICIGGTRLLTWPATAIHQTVYRFRLRD